MWNIKTDAPFKLHYFTKANTTVISPEKLAKAPHVNFGLVIDTNGQRGVKHGL